MLPSGSYILLHIVIWPLIHLQSLIVPPTAPSDWLHIMSENLSALKLTVLDRQRGRLVRVESK